MITLVLPRGAEDGPVSHGTTDYRSYLADITDPISPFLVDVPDHVAEHFMHRGGFTLYEPQMRRRLCGEMVRIYHPDGPRSLSWDGDGYDPDDQGVNVVPAEALPDALSFGFMPAPDRAELEAIARVEAAAWPGCNEASPADQGDEADKGRGRKGKRGRDEGEQANQE